MDINEHEQRELDNLIPVIVSMAELIEQQKRQYKEIERLMCLDEG